MNNNKKYKKWSLGLVAPALVLTPIAVVASCSSSGEEKEAYAIKFTNTDQIKATTYKTVQPKDLTDVQFKEEVLSHLSELFSVDGKLPAEDFISKNIEISELKPSESDDKKEVSAKVKVNNANTSGESIEKTITLTKLGYEEVTLTDLKYTIAFKDEQSNLQEIPLTGQGDVSVETMTAEKLIDLVLDKTNKDKILEVTGNDATKITDEVLANQILSATELTPASTEGKITFKLSVEKPVNGGGNTLEKTITFTGFKQETDSTPPAESDKFKIKFKEEAEFMLENVSDQSVSSITDGEVLKPIVIENKDKIFEAETGDLPGDDWWTKNLTIMQPTLNAANGSVTANISLDGYDTTETANQENNTLTKEQVVLKGFREEAQTEAITEEISTVTLGLNGTVAEVTASNEINEKWVLDNKRLLFKKGFNLIKEASDIKEVNFADAKQNKATLSFKVEANKWFSADGELGTTEQSFTIKIKGFPAANTKNQLLKNKLNGTNDNPLPISLVDPILGEGTYKDYLDNSATIFTNDFVFKYRKHLLTGDFTQIDKTDKDRFLKVYDDYGKFVKVVPNDSNQTIEIKFTILKDKLVPAPSADKEYSIVFNDFKVPSKLI